MPRIAIDRVEFRPSVVKHFLCILLSLPFLASSVFVLSKSGIETWNDIALHASVWLFFGGGAVLMAWILITREPRIVVDQAGLHLPGASPEFIPWSAIAKITLRTIGRSKGIGLVLYEPERYVRSDTAWRKLLSSLDRADGYHISIAIYGLDGSLRDVQQAIQRYSQQSFF